MSRSRPGAAEPGARVLDSGHRGDQRFLERPSPDDNTSRAASTRLQADAGVASREDRCESPKRVYPENALSAKVSGRVGHRERRSRIARHPRGWATVLVLLCSQLMCQSLPAASVVLSGPMIQGGLVHGRAAPGTRVFVDGEPVRVSPAGDFLIGFGRDAPAQTTLECVSPGGERQRRTLHVAARDYEIQRIDGLPPRTVSPGETDLVRIREEAALVASARARDEPRTDFLGGFMWPASGRITGVYGSQRILNGEPRRPHFGVDVAGPVGTPVVAPADGVVTLAEPDMFFSGGTLIIDHGHGLSSSLLHLSRIYVETGAFVKKGEKIAAIGATGRVTGAHLDWRMNLFARRLDPALLVEPMGSPGEAP